MRIPGRILLWIFGAAVLLSAAPTSAVAARRALLVAVATYDRGGPDDWADLHTTADVEALSSLLTRRFGFAPEDIRILTTPEETTHDAVVEAFRDWLIDPCAPDDVIHFHWSGHGTTVPDGNGDELDGLDESLVPSDYVSKHDGARNIRDDEIADLLDALADRHPGNVTLTFDCCYSGTATRSGRMLVRGSAGDAPAAPSADGVPDGPSGIVGASHPGTAGYVVLSATSQGQLAAETEDETGRAMGLFTYALVKAAETAGPETTYRDLYERVADVMLRRNRRQTPQIEGELDRLLFAGAAEPPPVYVPVSVDRGRAYLEAGSLQGVTEGSRYVLYSAGTRDFAATEPLAEATVSRVDPTYAELALDDAVDPEALRAARARESAHVYGDNRLRVDLGLLAARPRWRDLRESLAAVPLLETGAETAERWDVRLSAVDDDGLRLERSDGSELGVAVAGPDQALRVRSALESESRWRFLTGLRNDDPYAQIKVELRIAPVEVAFDAGGGLRVLGDLDLPADATGRLQVPAGTHVMLELRNVGYRDAHVTVLDLRGEGAVGPLWPYPGLRVQDNRIPADGAWVRIPEPFVFRIDPPGGPEMFKAIATAEPADFSPLLDRDTITAMDSRHAPRPPEADTPLGRLLRAATLGERSRPTVAPGNWATAEVVFEVIESE